MIGALLGDFVPWLVGAAVAILGAVGVYWTGKSRGRSQGRAEALKGSAERQERGRDAVSDLRGADDDAYRRSLHDNFHEW